jgi:hypothetical protein
MNRLPNYRGLAERSRRLADGAMDEQAAAALGTMARDYLALADELDRREPPSGSRR